MYLARKGNTERQMGAWRQDHVPLDEDLKIAARGATGGTHGNTFQPAHYPLEMYVADFPSAKNQR